MAVSTSIGSEQDAPSSPGELVELRGESLDATLLPGPDEVRPDDSYVGMAPEQFDLLPR